ncbi:MAG TPA: MFS transporter [Xanthobacteraceae bacterium]|jgi:MFS family permease|nr:MFS transporter [Xanthobacteraceae bacterium]
MTEATHITAAPAHSRESGIIGIVSVAHFVSHYFILILPPLFPFIRADYAVSYTELGLAIAAFNVVSALFQTPAGFLVDRFGPRPLLIAGLLLGAGSFTIAGFVSSFWMLVAMSAVAGLANTVYHPADYAILSGLISGQRIGRAFSIHTFAGMLGAAMAPPTLLTMQAIVGWRGALVGGALLGCLAAAIVGFFNEPSIDRLKTKDAHGAAQTSGEPSGWKLLMSAAILQSFVLYTLLSSGGGLSNYAVVALAALYDTPLTVANAALSGFLLLSAIGVLAGGILVGWTTRHTLVAALGFAATGIFATLIGIVDLSALTLIIVMSLAGFFTGLVMPSRDMIVRESAPPGSFGKVFGFVSTGFNVGGIIFPLIFGALMDHTLPAAVFLFVGACSAACILIVVIRRPVEAR